MNSREAIPVTVVSPDCQSRQIGGIGPILAEIAALLERLDADGTGGSIDLRGLPMSPQEYGGLRTTLGVGEVRATVDTLGASEVYETLLPGVWWVLHRGPDGEVTAQFIEVTRVPEIIRTHPDDVAASRVRIRELLDEISQPRS